MTKKVLWCSESSVALNSGFSTITKEIIARLKKLDPSLDIAEYGAYADVNHPHVQMLLDSFDQWKHYSAVPHRDDPAYHQYMSDVYGQFGKTLFERVCLDFTPDIVISISDRWMSTEWLLKSPYRDYFKFIMMPTIDGEPQREEWLSDYRQCDTILTYSQYGKDLLNRQAPDINVKDIVRPGVDHEVFKPLPNKKELRQKYGIPENANVILSVMRNQKRKLFPDLIRAFSDYLIYCQNNNREDLAKNTYLLLHTSYPDVGYDIGKHIMDSGFGHRILLSYYCVKCHSCYSSPFMGEITACKKCNSISAMCPNTNNGVSRETLAEVYNISDLLVQYSICEGLGMPICEAKACGISAMAVDYSAMSEQINTEGCWPIKVQRFFHESVVETEQIRALPNNNDLVQKLFMFFNLPTEERKRLGELCRKDAVENYSYDRAARIFLKAIHDTKILDINKTWFDKNNKFLNTPSEPTSHLDNSEYIDWLYDNVLRKPHMKRTYEKAEYLKGLNVGYIHQRDQKQRFDRNIARQMFQNMADNHNYWENARLDKFIKTPEILEWEVA